MGRGSNAIAAVLILSACIIGRDPGWAGDAEGSTSSADATTAVDTDGEGTATETGTGTSGTETTEETAPEETGPAVEHQIFVTSNLHTGNLGGRGGADARCMDRAAAASLEGEWVALISTPAVDARDAIPITGPVLNMNGETVADGPDDLWDGAIQSEFRLDEDGNLVGIRGWTGTLVDGTSSGEHCDDWSAQSGGFQGTLGNSNTTDSRWIDDGTGGCAQSFHLFCVRI